MAQELIEFGGPGHTSVLYTHRDNNANVELYRRKLNTVRILVNTPASQVCACALPICLLVFGLTMRLDTRFSVFWMDGSMKPFLVGQDKKAGRL